MNDDLRRMYDDFFGTPLDIVKEKEITEEINNESEIDIDSILLDEDSIQLLKKIVEYMKRYNDGLIKNYITFNIMLNTDNQETIETVIKVLTNQYRYLNNNKTSKLSLYSLEKNTNIGELYKNGIVVLSNLQAFELKDVEEKNLFLYNFKNNLSGKSITILADTVNNINSFLTYDNDLLNRYFTFRLNGINPGVQEVYNEVLNKVELNEENNIKLLDYIKETYKKDTNFTSYRDKLIDYISFNNEIPTVTKTKTNEEIFEELNELVGLEDVKNSLKDLVNLISLKDKTKDSLKIKDINLHMVFLGNPGTGKTTVARLLSGILYNLGYIKEDKLIEVSSKDLVAEYVGQTAPKTNAVVERAKGGILFIDEAYALASDNNSYNDEAIATLIKAMEDNRDNLVVIFAGYTKEMNAFLDSNSGIVSRVGYTLNFKDYTTDELLEIFKQMIKKAGFKITDGALTKARNIINDNLNTKNFGNARFVRNMYEKTVVKHATNTKDKKRKDKLVTIVEEDINVDNLIVNQ